MDLAPARGSEALQGAHGRVAEGADPVKRLIIRGGLDEAMRTAIRETDRRREIQLAYNKEHGITPETVQKGISEISDFLAMESRAEPARRRRRRDEGQPITDPAQLEKVIVELEEEMLAAAEELRFEEAARIRDELKELRRDLDAMRA